jgi:hypothetical protein
MSQYDSGLPEDETIHGQSIVRDASTKEPPIGTKEEPAMPQSIRPDSGSAGAPTPKSVLANFREVPQAVVDLFVGTFVRDIRTFFPGCRIESRPTTESEGGTPTGSGFNLGFEVVDDPETSGRSIQAKLFNSWYHLRQRNGEVFSRQDQRLIRAIGDVLELRCHFILQWAHTSKLELNRGEPGDHYIAASVEPASYAVTATRPSRVAATILTLRTMALSTYENRRISTGALLLGTGSRNGHSGRYSPNEALRFGVELTGLKSLHRLCDGRRSVFLVDGDGRLVDIVDIAQWASFGDAPGGLDFSRDQPADLDSPVPCARVYTPHALATRRGGHVCLVLSPNQEILVFAAGVQEFAFAHGRWRVLDPTAKFAIWRQAVADDRLARVLFQTALDLAEGRQGGLIVVVADPERAIDRLISPGDLLTECHLEPSVPTPDAPAEETSSQPDSGLADGPPAPSTKHALHYLARDCSATSLDPPVLEALAALDGALVTDPSGRLLAFGAILRHDVVLPEAHGRVQTVVEGARTTAALAASRFGPVLKISEDGIVSCFLKGVRAWDL